MNQQLIAACQMFLVPASILFAALGVANSEQIKTLVSLLGVITSGLWFYRVWNWTGLAVIDSRTALILAGIFVVAWVIAFIAHARLWLQR